MHTLDVICAETTLEDELEFFKFVCQNESIRIIALPKPKLAGPQFLSIEDVVQRRKTGIADARTIYLWNTSISSPLCREIFSSFYDVQWKPVDDLRSPGGVRIKTEQENLARHASLKETAITEELLRHGSLHCLLSPVIEVGIPAGIASGLFDLSAKLVSTIYDDVWVVWNPSQRCWEHETRNLTELFAQEFEQSPEFVEWQESIFRWIREHWGNQIIPHYTYRFPGADPLQIASQSLANLLNRNVAGVEPKAPGIS